MSGGAAGSCGSEPGIVMVPSRASRFCPFRGWRTDSCASACGRSPVGNAAWAGTAGNAPTRTRRADGYNSAYRRLHGARLPMDQPLTADHFKPHIGKGFKVKDGRHELTLAKVDLRRLEAHEITLFERPPFTLVFSGPPRD